MCLITYLFCLYSMYIVKVKRLIGYQHLALCLIHTQNRLFTVWMMEDTHSYMDLRRCWSIILRVLNVVNQTLN